MSRESARSPWVFLFVFAVILVSSKSFAQEKLETISPQAKIYLEQALELMQKNALNRALVDWVEVRAEAIAYARNAKTPVDTYPAIVFALTQLKEHHSFLDLPDNLPISRRREVTAKIEIIKGTSRSRNSRSPFAPQKDIRGHFDRSNAKLFAHLVVPMFVPRYAEDKRNEVESQQFADRLHSVVVRLQRQKPAGWVIDLRGNVGGDVWPMLAGIGAVLGEGDLGAFIYPNGNRETWFYRGGQAGTRPPGEPEVIDSQVKQPPFAFHELPWVAVLIDRGTGSSGEAVAISFAGRSRERSFGEHTAGYSTANEDDTLSDGAVLHLCVAVYADRIGRQYTNGIDPDVLIPEPHVRPGEEQDAALNAAEDWLARQIGEK